MEGSNRKELNLKAMGMRIRAQRESKGFSREKLAEELGVSSKFIVDIERGIKGISIRKFYDLCQILEVTADFFLAGQVENVSPERALLSDNIQERLKICNDEQLRCMEQIAKYYVKGIK